MQNSQAMTNLNLTCHLCGKGMLLFILDSRLNSSSEAKTVFKKKWNVKSHIRSVHQMKKPFKCLRPGCGKKYTRKYELKKHCEKNGHGVVSGLI